MSDALDDCFDRDGRPISIMEMANLHRDNSYVMVRRTRVGPWLISTVWLGINHNFSGGGPPIVFETMIFSRRRVTYRAGDQYRYTTEDLARRGHWRIVREMILALLTFRWLDGFRFTGPE